MFPAPLPVSAHIISDEVLGQLLGLISFLPVALVPALQRSRLCRLHTSFRVLLCKIQNTPRHSVTSLSEARWRRVF
jgi:hypothetical protein